MRAKVSKKRNAVALCISCIDDSFQPVHGAVPNLRSLVDGAVLGVLCVDLFGPGPVVMQVEATRGKGKHTQVKVKGEGQIKKRRCEQRNSAAVQQKRTKCRSRSCYN